MPSLKQVCVFAVTLFSLGFIVSTLIILQAMEHAPSPNSTASARSPTTNAAGSSPKANSNLGYVPTTQDSSRNHGNGIPVSRSSNSPVPGVGVDMDVSDFADHATHFPTRQKEGGEAAPRHGGETLPRSIATPAVPDSSSTILHASSISDSPLSSSESKVDQSPRVSTADSDSYDSKLVRLRGGGSSQPSQQDQHGVEVKGEHKTIDLKVTYSPQKIFGRKELFPVPLDDDVIEVVAAQASYRIRRNDEPLKVIWDFGAGGCSGFAIEAYNIVIPFADSSRGVDMGVILGGSLCPGLSSKDADILESLRRKPLSSWTHVDIFVSHKPADAYPTFPYHGLVTIQRKPSYIIGRSMIEADRIHRKWFPKVNTHVNEVWVPASFLRNALLKQGVMPSRVHVVPEPVNLELLDVTAKHLPKSEIVGDQRFLFVFFISVPFVT